VHRHLSRPLTVGGAYVALGVNFLAFFALLLVLFSRQQEMLLQTRSQIDFLADRVSVNSKRNEDDMAKLRAQVEANLKMIGDLQSELRAQAARRP
jgi:hypothetical protein